MGTKQEQVMTLIPLDEKTTVMNYNPPPDSKYHLAIFNEQQRHQWIMQAEYDKGKLAITLGSEIAKHLTREVKQLGRFLWEEVQDTRNEPELHKFMMDFVLKHGPVMVGQLAQTQTAVAASIYEAVHWSLNVLPPEEHKTFWQRLFGG